MDQNRFNDIGILNIERERIKDISIQKIIDDFANAKTRKKNFLKKFYIVNYILNTFNLE